MPEHGFDTELAPGIWVHTRFPWHQFNEKWQEGITEYVKSVYAAHVGIIEKVCIDHINIANDTFQSRIDFRVIPWST